MPQCQPDDEEICWICLDPAQPGCPLLKPCRCPRVAHHKCLARWQLHNAGSREEKLCRFCSSDLPDWRPAMTPNHHRPVPPYMKITYNGKTHKVRVQPGPDGLVQFEQEIRRLLRLPEGREFDVVFHCKAPLSGERLQLKGLSAFDAAVHCASVSMIDNAVTRELQKVKQKAHSLLRRVVNLVTTPKGQ